MNQHTQPQQLERYSFIWSQARLIIAALALFMGGMPPVYALFGWRMYGITSPLLTLAWIISGIASGYLFYRWYQNHQVLFGGKAQLDTGAFFVSVISGINLGLVGLTGRNIGMTIMAGRVIFMLVGLLYLATAYHLYQRWNASGKKIF